MSLTDAAADEDRDGDLTLLFTLGAVRSLADPADAVTDAREWSRYVGIVANDASAVESFTRRHGIENDCRLRSWDKWGTVQDLHETTDTPRHVFVGTTAADRRVATHVGWEFRTAEEAANRAGWALGEPEASGGEDGNGRKDGSGRTHGRGGGLWMRLRRYVRDRL